MDLTTHDWASFWAIAVGFNQDSDRLEKECDTPAILRKACLLISEFTPVVADDDVNSLMLAHFRHMVEEHQLKPTDKKIRRQPILRELVPAYSKTLTWLMYNVPE